MVEKNIQIDKDYVLNALFDNPYIAILVVDKNRNNILANNTLCKMFGYSQEEILATDVKIFHKTLLHYEEFGMIAFRHVLENRPLSINYEFKKKDGTKFWAKISGDLLKHEDYILWTLVDVTENIKTKDELKEKTKLIKTVIDETPYPIVLKNYEGKFILANYATARLYGCNNPDEMIGKDDGDYIPDKEIAEFFRKNVREIMDKGETQIVYEDSIDVNTNEVKNYMSIKKPFINYKGEKMILVLANEITELNKKNDELAKKEKLLFHQSKLASMGEMIANIAHQWRQPLSAISSLSSSSKLEQQLGILTNESFEANMDRINHTTEYLSQTIEDFRNFFNPKKIDKKELSIPQAFDKVINMISSQYKNSNIELIKEIDDININTYENELLQVLINILNNARDALTNQDLRKKYIFIKAYKKDSNSYIEILDNAKGIDENIIDKIFDPYFTTKHKSQGTGIGLYMVEEIVSKHLNAQISVENKEYEYQNNKYLGALFTLKF